jgi:hypothetical protein
VTYIGWWAAVYLAVGLWVVHTLHVCRFLLVGWDQISALPDWQIGTWRAFWLGFGLLPLAVGGVVAIRRWPRPATVVGAAVVCEIVSQMIGRSLFTLTGDIGVWGTVIGGYIVRRHYGPFVVASTPPKALTVLHAESLGVLRTLVNVCLFVIGTLGIAVTSNVISHYFGTDLGQGTAWVQVGSMLYLAFGMAVFMVWPLLQTVVAIRKRVGEQP